MVDKIPIHLITKSLHYTLKDVARKRGVKNPFLGHSEGISGLLSTIDSATGDKDNPNSAFFPIFATD